ncbi:oxidoreductase [Paenibacillus sp. WLX2291]|uniref:oxidoreductase n=1 Tax=Paenibacillus sp. WLX2291 TaxID=3296934 RepID=UPI003983E9ED
MTDKVALIAGATGLVGSALTSILLDAPEYRQIVVLVRKRVPEWDNTPRITQILVDYERLEDHLDDLVADDVYCCLGTTIKQAGTQDNMYRIDVTYPLRVAELAKRQGATQLLLVSAMGADRTSKIFYNRIKGELEHKLVGLDYPSFSAARPSLLLGERQELRTGERIGAVLAKVLSPLMGGALAKYKAIPAEKVARALYRMACMEQRGVHVYNSDRLHELGDVPDSATQRVTS